MNSLSLGFFFLIGLAWLLCETCVSASAGYWTPLWIYLAGFTVMFAIMGCLPVSTRTINTAGPIFTILIGAGLLLYGVGAFGGGVIGGLVRVIGGVAMVAMGVIGFLNRDEEAKAH